MVYSHWKHPWWRQTVRHWWCKPLRQWWWKFVACKRYSQKYTSLLSIPHANIFSSTGNRSLENEHQFPSIRLHFKEAGDKSSQGSNGESCDKESNKSKIDGDLRIVIETWFHDVILHAKIEWQEKARKLTFVNINSLSGRRSSPWAKAVSWAYFLIYHFNLY